MKVEEDIHLYTISKSGSAAYILVSIQAEFKRWHLDRQIDYLLLGVDPEEDLTLEWEN